MACQVTALAAKPGDLNLNQEPHRLPAPPEGYDLSIQKAHELNKERKDRRGRGGKKRASGWDGLPGFQLCRIALLGLKASPGKPFLL